MSKINTTRELRDEIIRLRHKSDMHKAEIRSSYNNFKSSLSPLKIIIALIGELKQDHLFNSALSVFEKVREYFKKKS